MATRINSEMIAKYTKEGHWRNKTLYDLFKEVLKKHPNKIAVVDRGNQLSFQDIENMSNSLASSLRHLGVLKGEVVSFELPNWYQSVILNLALTKLGAVINPIIPIYRDREVTYILKQAESVAIVIPSTFRGYNYVEMLQRIKPNLPKLRDIIVVGDEVPEGMIALEKLMEGDRSPILPETVDPNDIKLLLYTSGTTAEPKGVQHTHNTLICENFNVAGGVGLDEESVIFMPSPVTHITGYLYALELPLILGCKVVLMDIWVPEKALDLITKEKCTWTVGATPFLQHLMDVPRVKDYDLSRLTFGCGGAFIPSEIIKGAVAKLGLRAYRGYGSSESPTVSFGTKEDSLDQNAETDGRVVGNEIRIVDSDNNPLPFWEEGEVVVKGPEVFVGYRDPSLNKDAFDQEGWYHTGDLGRLSADGYLEITGRKKDIIIRGGENLSSVEIENFLYMHPSVEVAAAVAMPDVKMGEKVCAYVKLKKGAHLTLEELIHFLSQHDLAKQKMPERLELIDEFPMTPSGKIKKNELRKDIAQKLNLPPVRI
ncbi:MAG: AMP-binding protein [Deltaproteobacteria bacterium]|nr:AMP-binding protein [Deltaproteobacteria bacterium]